LLLRLELARRVTSLRTYNPAPSVDARAPSGGCWFRFVSFRGEGAAARQTQAISPVSVSAAARPLFSLGVAKRTKVRGVPLRKNQPPPRQQASGSAEKSERFLSFNSFRDSPNRKERLGDRGGAGRERFASGEGGTARRGVASPRLSSSSPPPPDPRGTRDSQSADEEKRSKGDPLFPSRIFRVPTLETRVSLGQSHRST
jgi:hypothetical protein